ncbi:MAG: hypothetical protein J0L58_10385 [Burkholderiales bacterium]|nr:hypothetical protein [Burkholderiales bacterium]
MITLITGAPGAGKTAALVDLLQTECERRALYVDGIPELKIAHVPLESAKRWPELVEDGAAVVIDEVQRVWRPRGGAAAVPPEVAALETHRHRGLDFYLVTQHPNLLDANVRRLVGRHVHLRDVGMLGRWWYEWPEAANPETFKSAPIKKRYTLPRKAFGLYRSASLHIKPIRSVPRALIVLGLALAALAGLSYRAVASISERVSPSPPAAASAASAPLPAASQPVAEASGPELPAQVVQSEPVRVVGCAATPKRCICYDSNGRAMSGMDWQLCQDSAAGFGGVVQVHMSQAPVASPQPLASAPAAALQPYAISLGGDARSHLR